MQQDEMVGFYLKSYVVGRPMKEGHIRASVEQHHGGLTVHSGVEQDHAIGDMKRNSEGAVLLLRRSDAGEEEQRQGEKCNEAPCTRRVPRFRCLCVSSVLCGLKTQELI